MRLARLLPKLITRLPLPCMLLIRKRKSSKKINKGPMVPSRLNQNPVFCGSVLNGISASLKVSAMSYSFG